MLESKSVTKRLMMHKELSKKTGLARIFSAFGYSLSGLTTTYASEAAFRQELFFFIVFLPGLYFLPVPSALKGLLLATNTLVLIVELLNSAIEAIVNLASPDYHDLAKHAKDMGSAAVMISVLLALLLWVYAIFAVVR
jgi:diacylglycerol kinase (ATP)